MVECKQALTMVVTGQQVIAGTRSGINAYNCKDGALMWSEKLDKWLEGLAVSNRQLLASCDDGSILCYSAQKVTQAKNIAESVSDPYWSGDPAIYREHAATAALAFGWEKGYCLVLGVESGQIAYEIARQQKTSSSLPTQLYTQRLRKFSLS